MAKYIFDERQSIDANLESFFDYLAEINEEYAGILQSELPKVVAESQTRAKFHTQLAELLDATPTKDETESDEATSEDPTKGDDQIDSSNGEPGDEPEDSQEPRRYYLTELKVEGFRGINNEGEPLTLRFDADKVNSVYAENGFGKSSLFDALSFAIRGTVPKLDRLEDRENAGDYYNNRFHTKRHAKIELTFVDDQEAESTTIVVERDQAGVRSVSSDKADDAEAFLTALRNDFLFLDQATFERFIRDPSSERGQCFTRLLGLSTLADYTATLKKLADNRNVSADLDMRTIEGEKNRLEEEKRKLTASLREDFDQLVGEQLTAGIDVSAYAGRILKALQGIQVIAPYCQVAKLSDVKFEELQAAVKTAETGAHQDKLTANKGTIKALEEFAETAGETKEQNALRKLLQERVELLEATTGPLLLANYRTAITVLESNDWDDVTRCPTCDRADERSLLEALKDKVAAFEQAEAKGREIAAAWRQSSWATRWRQLASHRGVDPSEAESSPSEAGAEPPEAEGDAYTRLAVRFSNGSATESDLDDAIGALKGLGRRRQATVERLTKECEKVSEQLPQSLVTLSTRIATAKHAREQLTRYVTVEKQLHVASYRLLRREAWQQFIKLAYDDFKRAEAKWVRSREQTIATTCQQMHLAITGNGSVVPGFDRPSNSSRLYLRLEDFHGLSGLSANTLLQESYCTSLAISVYLSTALLFKTTARFLVLDDVTSTFDGGHQWHLMELLRNRMSPPSNPDGLQVILLTHDSLLQKYLDKQSHDPSWRHYRLTGTPPTGNVVTNQEDAGRIKKRAEDFLSSGQADEAKPWVRQYLEQTVARIIRKCSIPVPFDYAMSEHKQQLEDSFNSIKREILLQQQAGSIVLTAQQQQDAVQTLLPHLIANMMSHYATVAGSNVSCVTLQRTLDATDKLADCFCYDCTCRTPGRTERRFYRDLSRKQCKC